jgi:hypothetical protein
MRATVGILYVIYKIKEKKASRMIIATMIMIFMATMAAMATMGNTVPVVLLVRSQPARVGVLFYVCCAKVWLHTGRQGAQSDQFLLIAIMAVTSISTVALKWS